MDRKNQAYEYPDSDPGVVQIIDENGKTINFTGTRLKDGTVMDSSNASVVGFDSKTNSIIYQLPDGTQFKMKK